MIERYTLAEMGKFWQDEFKFSTWLQIELLACEARVKLKQIPEDDVRIIKNKAILLQRGLEGLSGNLMTKFLKSIRFEDIIKSEEIIT